MRTTSVLALYKHQLARFDAVKMTARQMHEQIVNESFADAKTMTRGGIGPNGSPRRKWLARNRPFARNIARSRLRVSPLPIGIVTGDLYRKWRLLAKRTARGQEFHLRNSSAHAKHILFDAGTKKMRGRGFQAHLRKQFRARNKALVDTIRKRQAR